MMNLVRRTLSKRFLLSVFGLLALLSLFYLFYSYSFVEVHVSNHNGSEITYSVTGQNSSAIIEKTESSILKKLVRRGSYLLDVSGESSSGLLFFESGGFFRTQRLDIELVKEKKREFVAHSPELCSKLVNEVFYSWSCGGDISSLYAHMPPGQDGVPIKKRVRFNVPIFGNISGIIQLENTEYLIITSDFDGGISVLAYPVNLEEETVTAGVGVLLSASETSSTSGYFAQEFADGIMLYSEDGKDVVRFKSIDDEKDVVGLPRETLESLSFYSLTASGSGSLVVFGENASNEARKPMYFPSFTQEGQEAGGDIDFDPSETILDDEGSGPGMLFIVSDEGIEGFEFDFSITQARLCGDYLCILNERILSVYEVGANLKKIHTLHNITQIEAYENHLFVINDSGVMSIDVNNINLATSYTYSFGGFDYCGFEVRSVDELLVCVSAEGTNSPMQHILLIDNTTDLIDVVDKQTLELSRMSETNVVIPYRNSVYITPNIPIELDISTYQKRYDPERLRTYRQNVRNKIIELGIDRDVYSFFGPLFN